MAKGCRYILHPVEQLYFSLYSASIVLQCAALVFALRMIRGATVRRPWVLLASAVGCMAVSRALRLAQGGIAGGEPLLDENTFNILVACLSLSISILFCLAMLSIRRLSDAERTAAEAQRESEQRLGSVIDNMPSRVFIKDLEGRHVLVNKPYLDSLQRDPTDVLGRTDHALYPVDLALQFHRDDQRVLTERISKTQESRLTLNNGQTQTFLTTKFPVFDTGGRVNGVCAIVTDVTALREAEASIRESEQRLRLALDAGRMGIWEWELDTSTVHLSAHVTEILGAPEPIKRTTIERLEEWIHQDDLKRVFASLNQAIASNQPFKIEFRVNGMDGKTRWVLNIGQPFADPAGRPHRLIGTLIDVTERKAAEDSIRAAAERAARLLEETRVARAEAEAANKAKDRFLAVLSHELRTPLSPVLMTVEAMSQDPTLPASAREELGMVRRNIDLEVRLIDDLLDLSRIRNGKLRIQPVETHVHELLRHVESICRDDIGAKQLRLTVNAEAGHDTVRGDPARLQQIFWNLLKNAIKFTDSGRQITVTTRNPDPRRIEIEFRDEGIGIPQDMLSRLFNAFEQGRLTDSTQFGGLGLGLAISHAIAQVHGGAIQAFSDGTGKGARFIVRLPLVSEPQNARPATPPPEAKSGQLRLLLVEDHPDTAKVLARLLTLKGYQVQTANSVQQALETLSENRDFDVLVSDIGLPDADGFTLMRQVRDKYQIKGIAMSGYGMDEDIQKSRESGFIEHVVKPVNIAQLEEALQRVAKA